MIIRVLKSIFILGLVVGFSQRALAFAPPHINVVFKKLDSRSKPSISTSKWLKSCKRLASRLRVNKGPFGTGFFRSYSCYTDSKRDYGPDNSTDWVLEIVDKENRITLELKQGLRVQTKLELPPSEGFMAHLMDQGFSDLVVFALLNQMPSLMSFDGVGEKKYRGLEITEATKHSVARISPPEKLFLYKLKYFPSSDSWIPTIIGKANLRSYKIGKKKNSGKSKSKKKNRGKVNWTVVLNENYADTSGKMWAHSVEGRGGAIEKEKMTEILTAASNQLEMKAGRKKSTVMGSMSNFLLDTAASGYVGVRFGSQFLAGDDLLGKSTFWGILTEIRGGPLEGLRFYYDSVPNVESSVDSGPIFLEWTRITTGMSFGFGLGDLVDRIDVTPKLGVWSFSAMFPILTPDKTLRQEFKVGNRLSLGIELGLEWVGSWYTIRVWGGADQAVAVNTSNSANVKTVRFGFDAYFTAGPRFTLFSTSLQTNFLAFSVLESIKLDATKDDTESADEFRIDSISYESGYVGGGVAISW